MEPLNDDELDFLLASWTAPVAPASIVPLPHGRGLKWFWQGTIHVPVPLAIAVVLVILVVGVYAIRRPSGPTNATQSFASDFQPVKQVRIRVVPGGDYEYK